MVLRASKMRAHFHSFRIRNDAVSYTLRTRTGWCEYAITRAGEVGRRLEINRLEVRYGTNGLGLDSILLGLGMFNFESESR